MKTWDDWTDKQLNSAVINALGIPNKVDSLGVWIDEGFDEGSCHYSFVDYCNRWKDIGPIISDNGICLISPTKGRKSSLWSVSWNEDGGKWSSGDVVFGDKNPLRAAAIVFLMMNGVNP